MSNKPRYVIAALILTLLAGCGGTTPNPTEAQFKLATGINEIMAHMIEPAADAVWASVGITQSDKGMEEHQPRSDEEWLVVRRHAITLMESANLLLMNGRAVAMPGHTLKDEGTPGNLSAAEVQAAIDLDRPTFAAFAHALQEGAAQVKNAADAKNPQALLDAGNTVYETCAGCHLKFWYPGEQVPRFPDQAPEVEARTAK